MSKNETTAKIDSTHKSNNPTQKTNSAQASSRDIFSIYRENVDKLFKSIRQSVPQYHQSITNVQQEYLQAYEGLLYSAMSLQKEYAKKTGVISTIPDATVQVLEETSNEFVHASNIQDQIALATINATQQNIKTFNDNAKSFADLNRNILKSWISAFNTTRN